MTARKRTPEQEHAFYADPPPNQVAQGPPVRRKAKLSEPVPVRFPEERQSARRAARAGRRDRKTNEPRRTGQA